MVLGTIPKVTMGGRLSKQPMVSVSLYQISWRAAKRAIKRRLLDSALLIAVYPLTKGSSGTVARYLSR